MSTTDVKNLSIALEALTRVPGYDSISQMDRVRKLLDFKLDELEEYTNKPAPTPNTSQDDEIPF